MDTSLTVLKLTLDALKVDASITTVDDRKRVQKAIYLAQAQGLDLGYRYGWYIMGPYCPGLTQDYFKLHNEIEINSDAFSEKKLRPDVREKLNSIANLFNPPASFLGNRESWLELLASVHFLRRSSRKEDSEAREVMNRQKPTISSYYDLAISQLTQYGLLA